MSSVDNGHVRLKGLRGGFVMAFSDDKVQSGEWIKDAAILPPGLLIGGKDVGGRLIVPEAVVESEDAPGPADRVDAIVPADAPVLLRGRGGDDIECSPRELSAALENWQGTWSEGTVYSRRLASLESDIVTVAELREVLGYGRRTIYKMIQDGRIPEPRRRGRRYEWDRDVLVEWAEGL